MECSSAVECRRRGPARLLLKILLESETQVFQELLGEPLNKHEVGCAYIFVHLFPDYCLGLKERREEHEVKLCHDLKLTENKNN